MSKRIIGAAAAVAAIGAIAMSAQAAPLGVAGDVRAAAGQATGGREGGLPTLLAASRRATLSLGLRVL